jgi:hypothetical protein
LFAKGDRSILNNCTGEIFIHLTAWAAGESDERQVESVVKNWVNNEGYWVYYKVEVANEKVDLDNGVINADFICEAAKLDVDGKKSFKGALKTTIHSQLSNRRKDTKNELEREKFSNKDGVQDPTFDATKVEISARKNRKKRKRNHQEEE